jgi:O-antigen/teichoic acid export membrane protein
MSDKKNAVLFVFVTGINTLLNVIFAPYIARAFTKLENGQYGLILLVSNFMVLIFSLGISNVYPILLADNKNDINKVFTNSTFLLVCAGLVAGIIQIMVGINSMLFLNNNIYLYLLIFTISTFFGILSSILSLQLIYSQKSKSLLVVTLVLNALKILMSVIAIQYVKSFTLFIVFLAGNAALNYFLLFFLTPAAERKFGKINIPYCKVILKESYPYLILSFLGFSILYIDGILVNNLTTTDDYAVYRNGAIEIPFIATIYSSISSVMLNKMAILKSENKIAEIFELKKKTTQTIALLTYPIIIFLIVNADIFIPLYLSNKYYASAIIFSIFCIVSLIRISNYGDLLMLNRNRSTIIIANLIAFVVNIVLNYTLIKLYGSIGGAIAYVASILLLTVILVKNTIKSYQVQLNQYFNLRVLLYLVIISIFFVVIARLFYAFGLYAFLVSSAVAFVLLYFCIVKFTSWIYLDYLPEKVKNIIVNFNKKKI